LFKLLIAVAQPRLVAIKTYDDEEKSSNVKPLTWKLKKKCSVLFNKLGKTLVLLLRISASHNDARTTEAALAMLFRIVNGCIRHIK